MPSLAPSTRRSRPRAPRHDRRNPSLDRPFIRRQLGNELPELPRPVADEADVLDLTFLAAMLMDPPEPPYGA